MQKSHYLIPKLLYFFIVFGALAYAVLTNRSLVQAERSLHDALSVLSQTVAHSKTVLGGGCSEMLMAQAVEAEVSFCSDLFHVRLLPRLPFRAASTPLP